MANSNEKYSAALQLMNGFLLLYIKIGNSPTLLDSDFVIDDGLWHTIEVSRNRKTASLQVDGTKRKRKKFDNGKKRLNIESPIYIGGLPPNKNSEYLDTTSFDGCIRKFQLNTIEVDLTTKSNNSYGVFTCYTNVESGNYFQGIGHALLAEDQTIGANFEFIVTFRTTLREGVLFAGTNPDGVGISLQLVEDQVLLKLFTGRRMADISFGDGDNFTVCDHKWHTVLVMENEGLWKLSVDGVMANNLRGTLMFPEEERYSFFVGGNPLSDPEAVSFKGCIRRLTINGVDVAFESSEELLGVVPHECPVV
ncbi:laminin subunit alpha-4-like [Diadema setosum]|uniref:laminin subunit alpha-4-like n=1 Tax=Diadema setosum TaxID=31175 RepID=UPI003B3AEE8D